MRRGQSQFDNYQSHLDRHAVWMARLSTRPKRRQPLKPWQVEVKVWAGIEMAPPEPPEDSDRAEKKREAERRDTSSKKRDWMNFQDQREGFQPEGWSPSRNVMAKKNAQT